MLIAVLGLISGLVLLFFGAEYLVKGSSNFALSFGIRPLVIGMTVVALATSMPEMMVSLVAVLKESSDLAAGNVIGSNVANIGLILGTTALLAPMTVARETALREIPLMLLVSVLVFLMLLDGQVGRFDGAVLVSGLIAFLGYCFLSSRRQKSIETVMTENVEKNTHRWRDLFLIVGGILGLGIGAELMTRSAVFIARGLGVSDLVIGVTVVALGTSLPELAASTVSAWNDEADLSVGNVIGSNIFNLLFVLGGCALVRPIKVEMGVLRYELPVILGFSFALWLLILRRLRLGRTEGGLLLVGYFAFICYYLL